MSIPFSMPSLTPLEAQATHDVITSGRLILGPEVRAFAKFFAPRFRKLFRRPG